VVAAVVVAVVVVVVVVDVVVVALDAEDADNVMGNRCVEKSRQC